MGAGPHDRHIALMPVSLKKRPGLRNPFSERQASLRFLAYLMSMYLRFARAIYPMGVESCFSSRVFLGPRCRWVAAVEAMRRTSCLATARAHADRPIEGCREKPHIQSNNL